MQLNFRLLVCVLLFALPAIGQDTSAAATNLVRAMKTDFIFAQAEKRVLLASPEAAEFSDARRACISAFSAADYTEAIAGFVARRFSAQEMESALRFYQSSVGQRFVEAAIQDASFHRGETYIGFTAVNPEDHKVTVPFFDSEVGKKIERNQFIYGSKTAYIAVQRKTESLLEQCPP